MELIFRAFGGLEREYGDDYFLMPSAIYFNILVVAYCNEWRSFHLRCDFVESMPAILIDVYISIFHRVEGVLK